MASDGDLRARGVTSGGSSEIGRTRCTVTAGGGVFERHGGGVDERGNGAGTSETECTRRTTTAGPSTGGGFDDRAGGGGGGVCAGAGRLGVNNRDVAGGGDG